MVSPQVDEIMRVSEQSARGLAAGEAQKAVTSGDAIAGEGPSNL
ncbi:hypothetical protein [Ruegeria sp. HKCCD4318-2]|nr:hypothetical protein [Ruegeria sp. HKCCD4318-2]